MLPVVGILVALQNAIQRFNTILQTALILYDVTVRIHDDAVCQVVNHLGFALGHGLACGRKTVSLNIGTETLLDDSAVLGCDTWNHDDVA